MYYVYILYSQKLHKRYIGFTHDLKTRVDYYNKARVSYTSKGVPWRLIYYQAFCNKLDAQEEERFLKSGKGRERLKFLLQNTMDNVTPT